MDKDLSFGELLQTLRKQKKVRQQSLANQLGVDRSTIGAWERGDRLPNTRGVILELAKQLHLDDNETRQLLEASLFVWSSSYWYVPFLRNPFFTGRHTLLETLHHRLRSERSVALNQSYTLSGLGGIGKTQIALEYVYQHAADYFAIFWIAAETRETLYSGFALIAKQLQLPEREEQETQMVVNAVLRWLNTHKEWLLVFDNVEDISRLKPFLPSARKGTVLMTTRLRSVEGLSYILELPPLPDDEGVRFLLHRTRLIDPGASLDPPPSNLAEPALALVKTLGGLPLALDQAGAYIEQTGCSLQEYLQLFRDHQIPLLDERSEMAPHPTSVVKTFQISFERIMQRNEAAADLLRLCAFLAPDAIPEELFSKGADHLGLWLKTISTDTYQFKQTLREALHYSLLSRQPQNQTLSMHRLVQAVLRDTLSEKEKSMWAERAILAANVAFPDVGQRAMHNITDNATFPKVGYSDWPQCARLLTHAQVCVVWIEQLPLFLPEAPDLLNKAGIYLREQELYLDAERLLERGLALREQYLSEDDAQIARSLGSLAILYMKWGKYNLAEPLARRALEIRKKVLGDGHLDTALSLNNLAELSRRQGKLEEAEQLYLQALKIREQKLGPQHPDTARSLNGLANCYLLQGKYDEAESSFTRALKIREEMLGGEHPDTAVSLNDLALLYWKQRKYNEVEPLVLRTLAIFEQKLEAEHPQIAASLNGLANFYLLREKYKEARPYLKRALAIRKKMLGKDHPDTALSLNNLALVYRHQRKYDQAERLYRQALEIFEEKLGKDHSKTAESLTYLAKLYWQQEKYEQAEPYFRRALEIREKMLGDEHPGTAASLKDLAELYRKQGKYDQAEPLYQRAIAIRKQKLGEDHPDTATSLHNLAELYRQQGKYELAEPLYRRAHDIFEQHSVPQTAHSLHGLAKLYQNQGKDEDAEAFYLRAITICKQLGPTHPETQEIQKDYVAFLSPVGRNAIPGREPLRYADVSLEEGKFVDMTSLTVEEFNQLVSTFEEAFQERMKEWCLDGKKRLRQTYTTYANSPLPTAQDRLLFILVYLKMNPLQAEQGKLFGMPQNKANQWIQMLLPVLQTTLGKLGDVPTRSLKQLAQRLKLNAMEGNSSQPNGPKMRMNRKAIIATRKRATP